MKKFLWVTLLIIFSPVIVKFLFFGFNIARCGGLPIMGTAFAGDRWYKTPQGLEYFQDALSLNPLFALLSLEDRYFCSETQAQGSGFHKGLQG
jgi:hypothetical protein